MSLLSLFPQAHAETFMPPQASSFAQSIDDMYAFTLILSAISFVLVIGGLIYFAFKYRRKSEDQKTAYFSHNVFLEFLWSFIPFVIFMICFVWGWIVFHDMRSMPKDALEIHVVGQKWSWEFLYKSGQKSSGSFKVPINTPVKLIMSSKDVLHSFFVPAFRIKQDVIPGRYTALWFEAIKKGKFKIFCTEFCGTGHSSMLAEVEVMDRSDYEKWLSTNPYKGLSLDQVGKKVFSTTCVACHNTTNQRKVGPGFSGLFGSTKYFIDGTTAVADEAYIRESILYPQAKISKGFEGAVMTSFQGQLSENEILGIIEYIKTLKN